MKVNAEHGDMKQTPNITPLSSDQNNVSYDATAHINSIVSPTDEYSKNDITNHYPNDNIAHSIKTPHRKTTRRETSLQLPLLLTTPQITQMKTNISPQVLMIIIILTWYLSLY